MNVGIQPTFSIDSNIYFKFNLFKVNIPTDKMVAPATEPSQSLQPNVFKDTYVKSVIKKIANINTPNAKHPKMFANI